MSEHARHTIYALSSDRPPAAIAVVRISGPATRAALKTVIGKIPQPRAATLGRVRGFDGEIIDEGNHASLMQSGGHYAELYNTYFRHQSLEYIDIAKTLVK